MKWQYLWPPGEKRHPLLIDTTTHPKDLYKEKDEVSNHIYRLLKRSKERPKRLSWKMLETPSRNTTPVLSAPNQCTNSHIPRQTASSKKIQNTPSRVILQKGIESNDFVRRGVGVNQNRQRSVWIKAFSRRHRLLGLVLSPQTETTLFLMFLYLQKLYK